MPDLPGLQPCDVQQAGQPYSVHHAAAGDVGEVELLAVVPAQPMVVAGVVPVEQRGELLQDVLLIMSVEGGGAQVQTVAFAFDATHPDADDLAELGLDPGLHVEFPGIPAQLFLPAPGLGGPEVLQVGLQVLPAPHGGHRLDVEEEHLAQVADDFAAHGRCPVGVDPAATGDARQVIRSSRLAVPSRAGR